MAKGVWKSHGEDRSPGYAVQGEWRASPVVSEWRREQTSAARGRSRKAGTWMALVGGGPRPGQEHIGELVLAVVGPCWVPSAPDALRH